MNNDYILTEKEKAQLIDLFEYSIMNALYNNFDLPTTYEGRKVVEDDDDDVTAAIIAQHKAMGEFLIQLIDKNIVNQTALLG